MEKKQATLSNDSELVLKIKLINSSASGKSHSFLKKENKIIRLRQKPKTQRKNSINTIKINLYFPIILFAIMCNWIILWGWRHVTFILASQHYTHARTHTQKTQSNEEHFFKMVSHFQSMDMGIFHFQWIWVKWKRRKKGRWEKEQLLHSDKKIFKFQLQFKTALYIKN